LGVSKEKIVVLGDIKAYNVLEKVTLKDRITVDKKNILLAGSIHREEFDLYLSLFKTLKVQHPTLQLVVAPRHFHWKKELVQKTAASRYSFSIWDDKVLPDWSKDIILVCKIGELFHLYPMAKIYFLGGTFANIGGHNLLEPAAWGIPTVIGPYFYNCRVTAEALLKNNALIAVSNKRELTMKVSSLLKNDFVLKEIGENANAWLNQEGLKVKEGLTSFLLNF
jgi:3-deoxy-D-manno-octulosonic-acid transferase